jgi:hypothetical protein
MPAKFQEVFANFGVDEEMTPTRVIVPLKGANMVAVTGGSDLKVLPAKGSRGVRLKKLDQVVVPPILAQNEFLSVAKTSTRPLPRDAQIFEVFGDQLVGYDGVKLEAWRGNKVEATARAVVLQKRTVKIAMREVMYRDSSGALSRHSNVQHDVPKLLKTMNLIWQPQANIVFEHVNGDPVKFEDGAAIAKAIGSTAQSVPLPEKVNIDEFAEMFKERKAKGADFTLFFVKEAIKRQRGRPGAAIDPARGWAHTEFGFALIGDNAGVSTPAHEAGHLLGYNGHTSAEVAAVKKWLLMNIGGPSTGIGKVPFGDAVGIFNTEYRPRK